MWWLRQWLWLLVVSPSTDFSALSFHFLFRLALRVKRTNRLVKNESWKTLRIDVECYYARWRLSYMFFRSSLYFSFATMVRVFFLVCLFAFFRCVKWSRSSRFTSERFLHTPANNDDSVLFKKIVVLCAFIVTIITWLNCSFQLSKAHKHDQVRTIVEQTNVRDIKKAAVNGSKKVNWLNLITPQEMKRMKRERKKNQFVRFCFIVVMTQWDGNIQVRNVNCH